MMNEQREKTGKGRVAVIVAMARNRTIGLNNRLPWHIPADLKRFKSLTMGHHLIMGRKTFDSIGKLLPGRTTVVVTRNQALKIEGCIMAYSLEDAISACAGDDEIFIVGGAELYALAMSLVGTIYLTEIMQDIAGDTYFPEFDKKLWQELAREQCSQKTPQALEYHFVTYGRKE
ncbi:Dihydrofolate reductase [Candidatus Nitrotoga sp. HW29]|uniref:dihydrofolate reductase n=1 Tax=Candidatus Nitrotoga sp. HW29 TaxID=2886963 RepID=UPI001EF31B1E|nr:dihydrofolate reductase [Candidatus Nitrotoga sp. HW29]CAH1904911.1 Dihydrofolate reductase [Candidatus Nitrotoga sp. HW29]